MNSFSFQSHSAHTTQPIDTEYYCLLDLICSHSVISIVVQMPWLTINFYSMHLIYLMILVLSRLLLQSGFKSLHLNCSNALSTLALNLPSIHSHSILSIVIHSVVAYN